MPLIDSDRYLERIGMTASQVTHDRAGLARLHQAHLAHVPFENLDIVFAGGVEHDRSAAAHKILGASDAPTASRRGGWCFELNGTFATLLEQLGFDVLLLGAAVLLDGPSQVLEHLAIEVSGGPERLPPMLVDVGFGDSFDLPLELNDFEPQDGGSATFQFFASPQGTTLARIDHGVPSALLRFKRVAHAFDDFAPVAASMQADPARHWSTRPVITRLVDIDTFDRVTLSTDRLTLRRNGEVTKRDVASTEWAGVLDDWFGVERPGSPD